ncbi:MAG: hypothetical protein JXB48_01060 [Candidatus Latescibacteria bacterium]|nr:hypothetical protein [Candidatus Latescibacterota bacterium]
MQGKLTKERNIFILIFLLGFIMSVFFNNLRMQNILEINENFQPKKFNGYTVILTISSITLIYITYRFSRILRLSKGIILLYCILAPLSVIQLVPFILLLVKANAVKVKIDEPSE